MEQQELPTFFAVRSDETHAETKRFVEEECVLPPSLIQGQFPGALLPVPRRCWPQPSINPPFPDEGDFMEGMLHLTFHQRCLPHQRKRVREIRDHAKAHGEALPDPEWFDLLVGTMPVVFPKRYHMAVTLTIGINPIARLTARDLDATFEGWTRDISLGDETHLHDLSPLSRHRTAVQMCEQLNLPTKPWHVTEGIIPLLTQRIPQMGFTSGVIIPELGGVGGNSNMATYGCTYMTTPFVRVDLPPVNEADDPKRFLEGAARLRLKGTRPYLPLSSSEKAELMAWAALATDPLIREGKKEGEEPYLIFTAPMLVLWAATQFLRLPFSQMRPTSFAGDGWLQQVCFGDTRDMFYIQVASTPTGESGWMLT